MTTLNVLDWLKSRLPDTPEMRAIDREERALIELARTLRLARERAGLTQKQLAQRIGVSQAQISKWENVNANHTVQSILKYLNGLGAESGQQGAAELIMAVRATNGDYLPITALAEQAVVLDAHVHQELRERASHSGKNRRETIADLLSGARTQAGHYAPHVEAPDYPPTISARRYANIQFQEAA